MTDDTPYGGGGGMVMKPDPIFAAVEDVRGEDPCPTILLSPQGRVFTQNIAQEIAQHERIILICGRYEGVDERVRDHLVTDELSIGDYVLSGGEPAAIVVVDAIVRLLPGALGYELSAVEDSHATGILEGPHLHPPGGVQRLVGSRHPAVGTPRQCGGVATAAGLAAHPPAPPRSAGVSEADGQGTGVVGRAGWRRKIAPEEKVISTRM